MMRKRTRRKEEELSEGLINRLPDDILVNIISRLPLKEAARTSVLSNRWKYVWTFTTSLDFDAVKWNLKAGYDNLELETTKYINWVNNVLELHRGSFINEFTVGFYLSNLHQGDITNWIYIALRKRVQKISLQIYQKRHGPYYTFPQEFYNNLNNGNGYCSFGIKFLRCLILKAVDVSGDNLEFFIHNCPLLDRLCVEASQILVRLRVVDPSTSLKHLKIQSCIYMEEIDISAPSLLSFSYRGRPIKIDIENVPQLVDLNIEGCHTFQVMHSLGPVMSCFPELKSIELNSCDEVYKQLSVFEFPKLMNLLLWDPTPNRENLLGLTLFMKTCPFLQKLCLKLNTRGCRLGKKSLKLPKYSHQHLKVVELYGFLGRQFDFELVFYLFRNAIMLEKLMISVRKSMGRRTLKNWVKTLEAKAPQSVELVIV